MTYLPTEPTQLCVMLPRGAAQVLDELVRDGATNRVIGRRLYITEDTVKTHLKRVFSRLPQEYRDRTSLALGVERGHIVIKVVPNILNHRAQQVAHKRAQTRVAQGVKSDA